MKQISVFAACIFSLGISAQDIITKRNGDELQAKVTKVSTEEVEYKKWSNLDGPTYTIPKSEVFMVKYQNGDKDIFKEEAPTSAPASKPASEELKSSAALPASDNAEIISKYNESYLKLIEGTKRYKFYNWVGSLGVTKSSVLSSDEITISFTQQRKGYLPHLNPYQKGGREVFSNKDIGTIKKLFDDNGTKFDL